MRVLVIPEDFRKDQYMLKPIVSAVVSCVGWPRARVRVCQDPLLGGVAQAMNWERIAEIIDEYRGMVDVFLLCVDRDCEGNRRGRLDTLETRARQEFPDRVFLAVDAWQEIEAWVLAGHDLPGLRWGDIRAECHPKETYYLPFARERGLLDAPGEGRRALGAQASYARIRSRCDEVAELETRLAAALA